MSARPSAPAFDGAAALGAIVDGARPRLAAVAADVVREHRMPELKRAYRRHVRGLSLDELIAETDRAYERAHARWCAATSTRDTDMMFEAVWGWPSEAFSIASGELDSRVHARVCRLMGALNRALESGDVRALRRASRTFRAWPVVLRRWAFAYFNTLPEHEGAGRRFDFEPSEFLDVAIRLRAERDRRGE